MMMTMMMNMTEELCRNEQRGPLDGSLCMYMHERARKVETQKLSQYLYTTDFTVHDFTEQLFAKLFSVATL